MNKRVLQEKIVVNSKLIDYMVYDYDAKELEVTYKGGRYKGKTRKYTDFDSSALDQIVQSSSPGKMLQSVLKQMRKEKAKTSIFQRILSMFSF